jgi:hypothetical protein
MYYTEIDPFTTQEVYIARGPRDQKMQRALMQFNACFRRIVEFTSRELACEANGVVFAEDGSLSSPGFRNVEG